MAAVVASAFGAAPAQGQAGQLNFASVGSVNILQVPPGAGLAGNVVLDFRPPVGGGTGAVNVGESFGVFAPISFTPATQQDLSFGVVNPAPNYPVGYAVGPTPDPVVAGVNGLNQLILTTAGYQFFADFYFSGNIGIPQLPFFLTQVGPNVSAAIALTGHYTGLTSGTFTGTYTAQFNNTTVQGLIDQIEAGTVVPVSISATFNSTVPEPSTYVLMISGLLAIGGAARVRRRMA